MPFPTGKGAQSIIDALRGIAPSTGGGRSGRGFSFGPVAQSLGGPTLGGLAPKPNPLAGVPTSVPGAFVPTAWTAPHEQVYTGPNPNTPMAAFNPAKLNAAGHDLGYYNQFANDLVVAQGKTPQQMYDENWDKFHTGIPTPGPPGQGP